ncbi:MAG: hypothetical protein AB7V32_08450, partial [Candidatus Berkiella sp.]
MIKKKIGLICCTVGISFGVQAFTFEGRLFGSVATSEVGGFVQIPQGGSDGSTSYQRPSLNELRIIHNNFYTLGTLLSFNEYDLFFHFSRYAPHGNALLNETLLTHGKVINAGQVLATFLKYDYYVLGLGKRFYHERWTIFPFLQVNFLKFHYEYASFPIKGARTFNVSGSNLGLKIAYQLTHAISADLTMTPPLPITNFTQSEIEFGINKLIPLSSHLALLPRFSLVLQQFDYEDNQGVPNHIRIQNAPYGKI